MRDLQFTDLRSESSVFALLLLNAVVRARCICKRF